MENKLTLSDARQQIMGILELLRDARSYNAVHDPGECEPALRAWVDYVRSLVDVLELAGDVMDREAVHGP